METGAELPGKLGLFLVARHPRKDGCMLCTEHMHELRQYSAHCNTMVAAFTHLIYLRRGAFATRLGQPDRLQHSLEQMERGTKAGTFQFCRPPA